MNTNSSPVSKTDIEQLKNLHALILAERDSLVVRINALNESLAIMDEKRGRKKKVGDIQNNVAVTKISA
jgi:hypothetical protein